MRCTPIVLALLLAATLAAPAVAAPQLATAGHPMLAEIARAVPVTGSLEIEDVGELGTLELERFAVFAHGAKVVVHEASGVRELPVPDNAYFRGSVVGDPASRVVLSVLHDGIRGIVASGGSYWVLGRGSAAKAPDALLVAVPVDTTLFAADIAEFSCGAEELSTYSSSLLDALVQEPPQAAPEATAATYGARIAVETDQEYLALFGGNTTNATNYATDLLAYGGTIYSSEINTDMALSSISLWTTTDPWAQTSTVCGLFEFGRYWNDNNSGIDRTAAHFMSGKSNGGGVAWTPGICANPFNYDHGGACPGLTPQTDNYGGDYGYSGDMDGNFDINNPSVVWDIVVTTHEIGHNFDSPHTHCYAGIAGNPNQVDECYAGDCGVGVCHCGATSLPSGCPGQGQGCGTIMSYCHLRAGGLANIGLTFGSVGFFGNASERVPNLMSAYVVSTAGSDPSCLAPLDGIFSDGFESGDTSAWSLTVP